MAKESRQGVSVVLQPCTSADSLDANTANAPSTEDSSVSTEASHIRTGPCLRHAPSSCTADVGIEVKTKMCVLFSIISADMGKDSRG